MEKIKLVVENGFINSSTNSDELCITVFNRVFHRLVTQSGPLGKVQPLYIKLGDRVVTFGVLTLNQNGSYSFFPELPGWYDFDHMTFSNDLLKNNHHFTRVTDSGRDRVLPIFAEPLSNDMYHAATFVYKDHRLLKDAQKEVRYPEINAKDIQELQKAFVTGDKFEGSTVMDVQGNEGAICIQFFLIPTETDYKRMTFMFRP